MNVPLVHGAGRHLRRLHLRRRAFKKLPGATVRVYLDELADSLASLRGSFGFCRALDTTTARNQQRAKTLLTLPVLAIGGAESSGTGPGDAMKLAADNVQTVAGGDGGLRLLRAGHRRAH